MNLEILPHSAISLRSPCPSDSAHNRRREGEGRGGGGTGGVERDGERERDGGVERDGEREVEDLFEPTSI